MVRQSSYGQKTTIVLQHLASVNCVCDWST